MSAICIKSFRLTWTFSSGLYLRVFTINRWIESKTFLRNLYYDYLYKYKNMTFVIALRSGLRTLILNLPEKIYQWGTQCDYAYTL